MRHRKFLGRGRRPPSQWIPSPGTVSTVSTQSVNSLILVDASAGFTGTTAPAPQIARMTVARIRGQFHLNNSGGGVATVYTGVCIVPSTQPAANYPDPSQQANRDFDWMYLRSFVLDSFSTVAVPNNSNQYINPVGADVDVKVKRILEPDHRLVFIYAVLGSALSVQVRDNLRSLIMRTA